MVPHQNDSSIEGGSGGGKGACVLNTSDPELWIAAASTVVLMLVHRRRRVAIMAVLIVAATYALLRRELGVQCDATKMAYAAFMHAFHSLTNTGCLELDDDLQANRCYLRYELKIRRTAFLLLTVAASTSAALWWQKRQQGHAPPPNSNTNASPAPAPAPIPSPYMPPHMHPNMPTPGGAFSAYNAVYQVHGGHVDMRKMTVDHRGNACDDAAAHTDRFYCRSSS